LNFELNLIMFKGIIENIFAFRLHPQDDLKKSILAFITEKKIRAAWIITSVGSLSQLHLRFANQSSGMIRTGYFEIVSLVGTMGNDACHLHISVSDESGSTIGGHLLEGCIVYTTAEIVIGTHELFSFERELDPLTGYHELLIRKKIAK